MTQARESFEKWIHEQRLTDAMWPDADSQNRFWRIWQAATQETARECAEIADKLFTGWGAGKAIRAKYGLEKI